MRSTQAALAADEAEQLGKCRIPAYDAGIGDGWRPVGPCHKQRYLRYEGTAEVAEGTAEGRGAAGALLARLRSQLFATGPFARLLKQVCGVLWAGQGGWSMCRVCRAGEAVV